MRALELGPRARRPEGSQPRASSLSWPSGCLRACHLPSGDEHLLWMCPAPNTQTPGTSAPHLCCVLAVPFSPDLYRGTSPVSPSVCVFLSPAASGYGTQNIRLSRDAVKDFDCCYLSLQPCHDPVVT